MRAGCLKFGDCREVTGEPGLDVALVDEAQEHREVLRQSCVAAGHSLVFRAFREPSVERMGQWANLIGVESALGYRALHSAKRAPAVAATGLMRWTT